jgi:hypothetical protein
VYSNLQPNRLADAAGVGAANDEAEDNDDFIEFSFSALMSSFFSIRFFFNFNQDLTTV